MSSQTMSSHTPAQPAEPRKQSPAGPGTRWILRLLVAVGTVLLATGTVVYVRPTLAVAQLQRLQCWRLGMEQHDVQLGKFRIHYAVSSGAGKPLVLVHGLEGRWQDWLPLIPDLIKGGYKVYALDLVGFGHSDRPDVDYSIALQTDILRQFLDSQNLQQPDLAGWSMGGWISLKFTAEHPERVRRLILMDSAGLRFDAIHAGAMRPRTEHDLAHMMEVLTPHPRPIPGFFARDLLRNFAREDWITERALKSMYTGKDLMDGRMETVKVPVLILWGKQDVLTPPSIGDQMTKAMPQSVFQVLDDCGHLAPVECKGRVVTSVVEFLAADPPLPATTQEIPAPRP